MFEIWLQKDVHAFMMFNQFVPRDYSVKEENQYFQFENNKKSPMGYHKAYSTSSYDE